MSGKKIVLLGDQGTDHQGFPPTPVIAGSANVLVDGKPVARVGDPLAPHSKPKHPPHPRAIASGSATVLINGIPAAVTGGAITCGGITIGSGSVVIGDTYMPAPFSGLSPAPLKAQAKGAIVPSTDMEQSRQNANNDVGAQQSRASHTELKTNATGQGEVAQLNAAGRSDDVGDSSGGNEELNAEVTTDDRTQNYGPLKGECCTQPGEQISGTYFFPGAGMDGAYVRPMVKAMRDAGINSAMYVDRDKWSGGTAMDAAVGSVLGRDYDPRFPMLLRVATNQTASQFNLIGYSYGSVVAAQLAAKYARQGTVVDHLVLIGSPISQSFLGMLRDITDIRKVVVIDIDEHGDPIYAGMSVIELFMELPLLASQMPDSEGHFYYAEPAEVGNERRRKLAEELYRVGVR
ncbi:type VI secretion system PAAR protein [Marinobacter sp. NP-4(2019)]|uniref:type VI secretion system PAAR protein n=1 Tax=Marinobacter sp. NP-4(2019) TaxID=2488665 RepID=UPI000FC3DBE0|nr:type VI secretion system PAAR protein [Marinobacter sp. NP-4(2019)]AZT83658.1 type VI secretion system PAAR protein [Marinobacter sp. NP-4(2019)]